MNFFKIFRLFFFVVIQLFSGEILAAIPTINSITETSSPPTSTSTGVNFYDQGNTIQFTVVLSEAVTISGTPSIVFEGTNAGATFEAGYISGTGTDTIIFEHTVGSGLNDFNGIRLIRFRINTSSGESIESISTREAIDKDFADQSFTSLFIDGDQPVYSGLRFESSNGNTVGSSIYLKEGK